MDTTEEMKTDKDFIEGARRGVRDCLEGRRQLWSEVEKELAELKIYEFAGFKKLKQVILAPNNPTKTEEVEWWDYPSGESLGFLPPLDMNFFEKWCTPKIRKFIIRKARGGYRTEIWLTSGHYARSAIKPSTIDAIYSALGMAIK